MTQRMFILVIPIHCKLIIDNRINIVYTRYAFVSERLSSDAGMKNIIKEKKVGRRNSTEDPKLLIPGVD